MTTIHEATSRRRVDLAGVILSVIGLTSGLFAYGLVEYADYNVLVFVPAVVATTVGVTHISKREALRH